MEGTISQALLAVGGRASRLKAGGVTVPISKSFLEIAGRPLLFWSLCSLYQAGIRSLVIAGQDIACLQEAQRTLHTLPFRFNRVHLFHDFGWGVHGLPYQTRYLLDEAYIFECGHGLSTPNHYRKLMRAKKPGNVVFSAFVPHPDNPRQPVILKGRRVVMTDANPAARALAHPLVVDQEYARQLLELNFDIHKIIDHYASKGNLRYVSNTMPPEFDVASEMNDATAIYENFAQQLSAIIKL